jgi:hypothetical protein
MLAAVMPLPSDETTPPVTKINLRWFATHNHPVSSGVVRGHDRERCPHDYCRAAILWRRKGADATISADFPTNGTLRTPTNLKGGAE